MPPPAHLSAVHARARVHDTIKTARRISVALHPPRIDKHPPATPPHARAPANRCISARLSARAALQTSPRSAIDHNADAPSTTRAYRAPAHPQQPHAASPHHDVYAPAHPHRCVGTARRRRRRQGAGPTTQVPAYLQNYALRVIFSIGPTEKWL
ncbi:hypothetical protein DFH09DRAFT_1309738 [Mycena vulgaris]|nr:hypothetical protein DFH09DRAFT_1309738 [Mycena vulgaris]